MTSEVARAEKPLPADELALDEYLKDAPPASPRMVASVAEDRMSISLDDISGKTVVAALRALGTTQSAILHHALIQMGRAHTIEGVLDDAAANFGLAVLHEVQPKDPIETMLVMQMAQIHQHIMTVSGRLASAPNIDHAEYAEKQLSRLSRTYAAQVEALRKHRTGGEQKVTVEHVTVNEGGQAIVGAVGVPGGRRNSEPTT